LADRFVRLGREDNRACLRLDENSEICCYLTEEHQVDEGALILANILKDSVDAVINYPDKLKHLYYAGHEGGSPDHRVKEYTNELSGGPGRTSFHCLVVIPPAPDCLIEVFDFYAKAILIKSAGERKRSQKLTDHRVLWAAMQLGTHRPSANAPLPELERI